MVGDEAEESQGSVKSITSTKLKHVLNNTSKCNEHGINYVSSNEMQETIK